MVGNLGIYTVDLVNLSCPKFADIAFLRICRILIDRLRSHEIGKLKTAAIVITLTLLQYPQEERAGSGISIRILIAL